MQQQQQQQQRPRRRRSRAPGAHVRAGAGEHAIALGDGSYIGFPTPCGKGRGCGNPLCTMSCIRRVSRSELLHWAGSSFEAQGGELEDDDDPPSAEAALRAVHLLGRDGSLLFEDEPSMLARWCTNDESDPVELRPSDRAAERSGSGSEEERGSSRRVGWEPWDAAARAQAECDLTWLQESPLDTASETAVAAELLCPISAAVPRQPHTAHGEAAPYEGRLLLRWLEAGMPLHPSSGKPLENVAGVVRTLRAIHVAPDLDVNGEEAPPPWVANQIGALRAMDARDWLRALLSVALLTALQFVICDLTDPAWGLGVDAAVPS